MDLFVQMSLTSGCTGLQACALSHVQTLNQAEHCIDGVTLDKGTDDLPKTPLFTPGNHVFLCEHVKYCYIVSATFLLFASVRVSLFNGKPKC